MEDKIKPTITLEFPDAGDNKIQLYKLSATYCQEGDCAQNGCDDQELVIETANGGVCADDTFFIIKTGRWAVNDPNDIAVIMEDFKRRLHAHEDETS